MEAETINAYFTPLDYFLYLFVILVIMATYFQFTWTKICREKVLVLIKRINGAGDWMLSPIQGDRVELPRNPADKETTGLWAINELSFITVPYPGVGFIPRFLQKQIRLVVVSEEDWEPISSVKKHPAVSPYFVGSLRSEKVTEAVTMANKELIDFIKGIGKILNPNHFYIAVGLIGVMLAYIIFRITPLLEVDFADVGTKLDTLIRGLGL